MDFTRNHAFNSKAGSQTICRWSYGSGSCRKSAHQQERSRSSQDSSLHCWATYNRRSYGEKQSPNHGSMIYIVRKDPPHREREPAILSRCWSSQNPIAPDVQSKQSQLEIPVAQDRRECSIVPADSRENTPDKLHSLPRTHPYRKEKFG